MKNEPSAKAPTKKAPVATKAPKKPVKPSKSASKTAMKTKASEGSVEGFLATVDGARRAQAETLCRWMREWTGFEPKLWGTSIVGFGQYRYVYDTGRSGDWPLAGFSPRSNNLTVYLMDGFDGKEALLRKLGKHKLGKSCLSLPSLEGVDAAALEALVRSSVAAMQKRYPSAP